MQPVTFSHELGVTTPANLLVQDCLLTLQVFESIEQVFHFAPPVQVTKWNTRFSATQTLLPFDTPACEGRAVHLEGVLHLPIRLSPDHFR